VLRAPQHVTARLVFARPSRPHGWVGARPAASVQATSSQAHTIHQTALLNHHQHYEHGTAHKAVRASGHADEAGSPWCLPIWKLETSTHSSSPMRLWAPAQGRAM